MDCQPFPISVTKCLRSNAQPKISTLATTKKLRPVVGHRFNPAGTASSNSDPGFFLVF